ncbi:hypothetical protein BZARG_2317 [Bizionia argentinensis JUB59]|uniref:Uncharacterized protein n=1 Tax=Bizionia argentinensis JUB59 TaxID=1046627 RepID=G2EGQ9_9FLAO|nr:hypothetical protein [Bizionia argentinensis]EGV42395.1 hypothetical protein BZARG_2317 [Bizionia argentinensis JUB59]
MKAYLCLLFGFISVTLFSQNKRDTVIDSTIYPLFYNNYELVKNEIIKLEENYGYESNLKYLLLNRSFEESDINFFKTELTTLVKDYGFNLAYEPDNTSYYEAITTGELAVWFKSMYLKNHVIWLDNNFLKQADLRQLNGLQNKTVMYNKLRYEITQKVTLDSIQKKEQQKVFEDVAFENLSEFYALTRKLDKYPTGKNFALIQNDFTILEYQNFGIKRNFEKSWILFEPFYRKAYLKHAIDYTIYKRYDVYSFIHYKNQRYGLISIFDIPETYQEDLFSIPIRDLEFSNKAKTEFNWKK